MTAGIVILVVYMLVLLGIAYYASKQDKKNIKDFATGGGLGIFVLTLTFSATYHSAYAFMGAGGFVGFNVTAGFTKPFIFLIAFVPVPASLTVVAKPTATQLLGSVFTPWRSHL